MLVFKGQLDGRVKRRLHKNSWVKNKSISYCQPKARNNMIIMKDRFLYLEEVLSLCIEEGHDAIDEWFSNAQNWYRKG